MESKLIVKNFGPIKNVNLSLKNVNVFIGPQATGKSALAKLYTIFKAPRKFFYKNGLETKEELVIDNGKASQEVKDIFGEYNINSFLGEFTEIEFESELHTISYRSKQLEYKPKLFTKISNIESLALDFKKNKSKIITEFEILANSFILFQIRLKRILRDGDEKLNISTPPNFDNLKQEQCLEIFSILKSIEKELSTNTALYIPAERSFINIIKKSALNLIFNKVPIPKHILSFGAELEKLEIKEINLDFIQKHLMYKIINGEDRIYIDNEHSIMLTESASGIQSVVPILAPILNKRNIDHRSFVIEEPELNLFPIAQYELIQKLESTRHDPYWEDYGTIHTYTTHSPYILSALNNLLYAYKVKSILNSKYADTDLPIVEIDRTNDAIVKKIVKADINPTSFMAYQICDGSAEAIFNKETGLIEENYIDIASDKITDDFEALMELTK